MPGMQQFSFTDPYSTESLAIERRRRLAEALQAQGQTPLGPTEMVGGWAVKRSPLEGAAKLAQSLSGTLQENRADEQQKALGERYKDDLMRALSAAGPHQEAVDTSQEGTGSMDMSGTAGPATRTVTPDRQAVIKALAEGPPLTQQMAVALQQQDIQRQGFMAAGGMGAPQAQGGAQGQLTGALGGQPSAAPAGAPAGFGGPAGGQPMAVWLQLDPTGKAYTEQLAKDYAEGNKPVVNRGFGLGKMVNGQYVPDQASLDQALAMERGKQGISGPQEPPVTLKTSSGQEVQLSRPEWAAFQQSGQLPPRLGGPQQVSEPTTDERAAMAKLPPLSQGGGSVEVTPGMGAQVAPKQAGVGTVGMSQPQEEQIRQAGQTASNTEAGKAFIAEMRDNYAKLRDVPATLANIDRAKNLAAGQAKQFMGPFGESKLAITKFMRANIPGMENIKTEGVTSAEELQSTLFNQVMDNLKKMDASPSQYQQQVMQEAFGTLRTDAQSVPKILDVFSDILRNRVDIHNTTVTSAEGRGTTFPYDVKVKLPDPRTTGPLPKTPANGAQMFATNGTQRIVSTDGGQTWSPVR